MAGIENRSLAELAAISPAISAVEQAEQAGQVTASPEARPAATRPSRVMQVASRFGLLAGLAAIIIVFAILKPDSFPTIANFKSTADIAAPLLVLSVGLTVPLSMGEFDLSIANSSQLSAAAIISLISIVQLNWGLSVVIDCLGALAVGGLIGFIVVRSGVNAFIITLGAGTVMAGVEFGIAHGSTIFANIPSSYITLGSGYAFGVPVAVIVALVFAILVWLGMERTVAGRRMRAIGGNLEAARLSGVRVDQLRAVGFMVSALAAAIAAVLLTAGAASYYPNAVTAELLPAYAACFLGTTVFRSNIFEVTGTIVGVAFLAVIQDGLIIAGISSWIAQVVEGSLLAIAVIASRAASRKFS